MQYFIELKLSIDENSAQQIKKVYQDELDRIVKNIFRKYSEVDNKFSKLPYIPDEFKPKLKIVSKGITPSEIELIDNNRARSSRLRVVEKIRD